MRDHTVHIVSQAIRYIEDNMDDKMDLDGVAAALHYSKFYLHQIFTKNNIKYAMFKDAKEIGWNW